MKTPLDEQGGPALAYVAYYNLDKAIASGLLFAMAHDPDFSVHYSGSDQHPEQDKITVFLRRESGQTLLEIPAPHLLESREDRDSRARQIVLETLEALRRKIASQLE